MRIQLSVSELSSAFWIFLSRRDDLAVTNGYILKRTAARARSPRSDTNAATTPTSDKGGCPAYRLRRAFLYTRYSMVAAMSENNPIEIINTANWRGPMTP